MGSSESNRPRSRRNVLIAGAGGIAAVATATLARSTPIQAAGETVVIGGQYSDVGTTTRISSVQVPGLRLEASGSQALIVRSTSSTALMASSEDHAALEAYTTQGNGVYAAADGWDGTALYAEANPKGFAIKTVSGRVRLEQVSGVATIKAGRRGVEVKPGVNVIGDAFVLLTPMANLGGRDLWYTTDPSTDTFMINLSKARTTATRVAWLLLG